MSLRSRRTIFLVFLVTSLVYVLQSAHSTGESYTITGTEDFLIPNYESLPFKRQILDSSLDSEWKTYVNTLNPEEGNWENPALGDSRFYEISYKCLSYASSTVNDWFNVQYGLPMLPYQSYLNNVTENGTNPRLLEQMYHDEGSFNKNLPLRGWPYTKYYYVPSFVSLFDSLLGDYCKTESNLTDEQCNNIGNLDARDPITNELIAYNLGGFAELLANPLPYIEEADYNLPSLADYTTDTTFFNIGGSGYYSTGSGNTNRDATDEEKIKSLLQQYGPLLAFTEEHISLTDWSLSSYANIHSVAIVGYDLQGGTLYFIAHDNYNDVSSDYIKLTIDEIDHVYYFLPQKDWPTFHHDNRRTGFTLLKGDWHNEADADEKIMAAADQITSGDSITKISVADINGDEEQDVVATVVNGSTSSIVAYSRNNIERQQSSRVRGKSVSSLWRYNYGSIARSPTIGDFHTNSGKEVVFGDGEGVVTALSISDETVTKLWNYTIPAQGSTRGTVPFHVIADYDRDGNNEVIFQDLYGTHSVPWNGTVWIINGQTNASLASFGTDDNGGNGAISIANLDADTYDDIVVPAYYNIIDYEYNGINLSKRWNFSVGRINGAAVIVDIDRDNSYEIIFQTTATGCKSGKICLNRLYVLNATGSQERVTAGDLGIYPLASPTIADLHPHAGSEIVTWGTYIAGAGNLGELRIYNSTLSPLCSFNNSGNLYPNAVSASVADINGDGNYDIIFPEENSKTVYILNNTCEVVFSYNYEGVIGSSIAIADLDDDGKAELAVKRAGSPFALVSFISPFNDQPILQPIENFTVIAGMLININESGRLNFTDVDGDNLTLSFSSPFNSTGYWQTTTNDSGNYSIIVEVSDGNLTASQYVNIQIFNQTAALVTQFADNTTQKYLNFTGAQNQSIQIRIPKEARILHTRMKIQGGRP